MIYSIRIHTKLHHQRHVVWTTKYRYKVMRIEVREAHPLSHYLNMPITWRAYGSAAKFRLTGEQPSGHSYA